MSQDNILVTGFGPFGDHKVNASWEAVKCLPDQIEGYTIIKKEIPVSYRMVDTQIPQLWTEHTPKLVIHVGVSRFADKITLETRAYKTGYSQNDIFGQCPSAGNQCSAPLQQKCLKLGLNIRGICEGLNNCKGAPMFCTSSNAGRYLCEYTFFTSLSVDSKRSLFIHVPMLENPYTAEQIAGGIRDVIVEALKQLYD